MFCSAEHTHSSVTSVQISVDTSKNPNAASLPSTPRPSKNFRISKADRDVSNLSRHKNDTKRGSARRRRSPSFEIRHGKPSETEESRRSLSWSLLPKAIFGFGSTVERERGRDSKPHRRRSSASKDKPRTIPAQDSPRSVYAGYEKQHQDKLSSKKNSFETGHSRHASTDQNRSGSTGHHIENCQDKLSSSNEAANDSFHSPQLQKHSVSGVGTENFQAIHDRRKAGRTLKDIGRENFISEIDPKIHSTPNGTSPIRSKEFLSKRFPTDSPQNHPISSEGFSSKSNHKYPPLSRMTNSTERKSSNDSRKSSLASPHNCIGYPNASPIPDQHSHSNGLACLSKEPSHVRESALAEGMLNNFFRKEVDALSQKHMVALGSKQTTNNDQDFMSSRYVSPSQSRVVEFDDETKIRSSSLQANLFAFPSSSSEESSCQDSEKLQTNVWEEAPDVSIAGKSSQFANYNGVVASEAYPKVVDKHMAERQNGPGRMPESVARAMEKNRARGVGGPLGYLMKHHEAKEREANTRSTGLTSLADESVSTHKTVSITGEEHMYVEGHDPWRRRRCVRENGIVGGMSGGGLKQPIFQNSALFERSRSPRSGGESSPHRLHSDWSDPHATDIDVYCQCNCSCVYEEECRRSCDLLYGRSPSVSSTKSCGKKVLPEAQKVYAMVNENVGKLDIHREPVGTMDKSSKGCESAGRHNRPVPHPTTESHGNPEKAKIRANTIDELPDLDSGRRLKLLSANKTNVYEDADKDGKANFTSDVKLVKNKEQTSSEESEKSGTSAAENLMGYSVIENCKSGTEGKLAAATAAALGRRRELELATGRYRSKVPNDRVNGSVKNKVGDFRNERRRLSIGRKSERSDGRGTSELTKYKNTDERLDKCAHGHEDDSERMEILQSLLKNRSTEKYGEGGGTADTLSGSTGGKVYDSPRGRSRGLRRSGRTGQRHRMTLFKLF